MKKYFLFFLVFISSLCGVAVGHQQTPPKLLYNLSIATIFRDEAPYLKEWIEYHRLVGVKHFYLYNHHSQDNFLEVLDPYIKEGIVELDVAADQADFNGTQVDCYNRSINKSSGKSKWVAFIDTDEFLVAPKGKIVSILAEFENESIAGVALNWRVFGTSNVKKIPKNELMIECLTRCSVPEHPMNTMIKSVVRPERTSYFGGPHCPFYVTGFWAVNTDGERVDGPSGVPKLDKLWLNHYWTRDQEYFQNKKIPRRIQWYGGEAADHAQIEKELNATSDKTILKCTKLLRSKMHLPQKNKKKGL